MSKSEINRGFNSTESMVESEGPASEHDFKMIFMDTNRTMSQDGRSQALTLGSYIPSFRTVRSTLPSMSMRTLKKAVSTFKIHSWKTDYITNELELMPAAKKTFSERIGTKQVDWFRDFSCTTSIFNTKEISLYHNFLVKIRRDASANDILSLMLRGVSVFFYNMQYGTVEEHTDVWNRVAEARRFASQIKDTPFMFSIIPELSFRAPMTGKLKRGLRSIILTYGQKVIVTADRAFAQKCSKKVIYFNFRHYILLLRPPDTIQIGDVSLRVRKVVNISAECDVMMGGKVLSKMEVHLPLHCRPDMNRVSCEELQDLAFLLANGTNCLLLPTSGNPDYFGSIRNALNLLKFEHVHVMTRVSEEELQDPVHVEWLLKSYEAVILMCGSCCPNSILENTTKDFIKRCYEKTIPLIVQWLLPYNSLERIASTYPNDNFEYLFFYPDGYYLRDYETTAYFHHLQNSTEKDNTAEIERIALAKLNEPFVDKSLTGSDSMARVIAKMSYDFNAKAIFICSTTGKMVIKISHFRPKCQIIALTQNQKSAKFLKIYHGVQITFYQETPTAKKLSRPNLISSRLLHGLLHAISLQIIEEGDVVIFCYKDPADVGYANAVVPFVLDMNVIRGLFKDVMTKGETE